MLGQVLEKKTSKKQLDVVIRVRHYKTRKRSIPQCCCGFYMNRVDKIASWRFDPPMRQGVFQAKKMASAAPGFGLTPFRINSSALEPARLSLVGHPPINASSIALTSE